MTFSSPEAQDAYHKLSTYFQHIMMEFEDQFAYRKFHFHIESVSGSGTDSDIVLRITAKPIPLASADGTFSR